MEKYIAVINGPNLNLLGKRQPEIYGTMTLEELCFKVAAEVENVALQFVQHNSEGDIIDSIHSFGFDKDCMGIVLNAGAYTHYSYAIADAIAAIPLPVVEVHISNIAAREEFRSRSVIAPVCRGSIAGFGIASYTLAVTYLIGGYGKN